MPKKGKNITQRADIFEEQIHRLLADSNPLKLSKEDFINRLRGKISAHAILSKMSRHLPVEFNGMARFNFIINLFNGLDDDFCVTNKDNQKICLYSLYFYLKLASYTNDPDGSAKLTYEQFFECLNQAIIDQETQKVIEETKTSVSNV